MEKDVLTSARLRGFVSFESVYMYSLNVYGTPPVPLVDGQRPRQAGGNGAEKALEQSSTNSSLLKAQLIDIL